MTADEIIARGLEVFDVELEGLRRTRESVGASFSAAVELILSVTETGGIAVLTGVGKSLIVAEKMSATFSSTGTRSIVLDPVEAMHGDLGMVSARDVLVALSFSGESDEILRLMPAIRRHGLRVVSLTGRPDSTLARLSDIHIEIPCGREACPFGMAPTTSTTATLVMGDALAMALVDARKFTVEDYAGNHPAGAIGRALVLKVSDIMRTGEKLAKVAPTATVMDALLSMTRAQGGSAVVTDADGKLQGIFTDGDFRRHFSAHGVVAASTCVSDIMTARPLFVYSDAYAADLLKIFERKRIDDLPVCDREGRVVGLVDIQDLPKMKVI